MEYLQSYLFEFTESFTVVGLNEPAGFSNPVAALGGIEGWGLSQNTGAVRLEPAVDIPLNAMITETIAESSVLSLRGVEP